MNLFKRISSTLTASVDHAVRQIENHDALVDSSIKEVQQHIAQTQVRLTRAKKEGQHLSDMLQKLHGDEVLWTQRAQAMAINDNDADKQQALACLKRRNGCQQQIQHYTELSEKQTALEQQMLVQLTDMRTRLDEIKLTQQQMRSRNASSEVQRVTKQLGTNNGESLEDIFERWEVKLSEAEVRYGEHDGLNLHDATSNDPLERQYLAEEEQALLEVELAAMASGGKESNQVGGEQND